MTHSGTGDKGDPLHGTCCLKTLFLDTTKQLPGEFQNDAHFTRTYSIRQRQKQTAGPPGLFKANVTHKRRKDNNPMRCMSLFGPGKEPKKNIFGGQLGKCEWTGC